MIAGIELRSMKPSQFLQKLRTVATFDLLENLIKILWFEKLSDCIKNILPASKENLHKLAIVTDKMSDMNPKPAIFAAHNKSEFANDNAGLNVLNELL